MPLWLKALLGALLGTILGAVIALVGCALVVANSRNGATTPMSGQGLFNVVYLGFFAVLIGAAIGLVLGLTVVLMRARK